MPAKPAASPIEFGMNAWKRQMDITLQIAEALVEGAERAREIQLAAGVDAHALLEAARKAIADAQGPTDFAAAESRLLTDNLGKVAGYWAQLAANARDTQGRIFKLMLDGSPVVAPANSADALTSVFDAGYKQWLETLRTMYAPTTPH